MSSSWSAPDVRRPAAAAPSFGLPYDVPVEESPPLAADVRAGALTAVVTVLLGAPAGLLWAAFAPRVDVVVAGADVQLVQPGSSAFIAGDGIYLLVVLLAGVVCGLAAWRLARAHGPAVVLGLTAGGLIAAYVAMVVGQQVGLEEVQQAVSTGQQGALELSLRLRSKEAMVGWPVGAMVAYVGASFVRGR